jgi:hypothetical protein
LGTFQKNTAMTDQLKHIARLTVMLLFTTQSFAQVYQQSGTGWVGVGPSTSPRGRFDVNGSGDIYLNQDPINGAGQSIFLPGHIYISPHAGNVSFLQARRSDNSGSTQLNIRTMNNGSLTEAMQIQSNGDIGISTSTPQARLDIGSGNLALHDNNQIRLRAGNNPETTIGFFYDGVNADEIRIVHRQDVYNRHISLGGYAPATGAFVPQLRLNTKNGNIGIGTDPSTSYKLAVNGKTWTTEVNVSLTVPGPDYVFEKDYALPSLEWVKSYVNANKHLPEVPSAREMEKDGINVGEINMLMLKKIEELTLYTIQLREELETLKAEMKKAR